MSLSLDVGEQTGSIGKSFWAMTTTRYLRPCAGTTNEDSVASWMSAQAAVQSCHW